VDLGLFVTRDPRGARASRSANDEGAGAEEMSRVLRAWGYSQSGSVSK